MVDLMAVLLPSGSRALSPEVLVGQREEIHGCASPDSGVDAIPADVGATSDVSTGHGAAVDAASGGGVVVGVTLHGTSTTAPVDIGTDSGESTEVGAAIGTASRGCATVGSTFGDDVAGCSAFGAELNDCAGGVTTLT